MNIRDKLLFFLKGSSVSKILGFSTFLLFAKVVSLEDFATYAIFLFMSEILTIMLTYGFQSYILRHSDKSFRDTLFPKVIFIIILTFSIFYIFIHLLKPLLLQFTSETYTFFLHQYSIFLVIIFSQCLLKMIYGYLISNHLAREHMRITVFHGSSKLIIATVLYYYCNIFSLNLILYSILLSNLLTLVFSLRINSQIISLKAISFVEMISLVYEASPFMFKSILGIVSIYLSRVILDGIATKEEVAIYSFYLMIVLQLNFFSNVISQSVIPTIRDSFDKVEILKLNFSKYLKKYFIFASITYFLIVCVTYVISVSSTELLRFFIKEDYLTHVWLIPVFTLSYLIGMPTTIYNVWQYHESMDVRYKLVGISIANLMVGTVIYPVGYFVGNIYGVAVGYLIIATIFTCVNAYYFKRLIRIIEDGKNLHNC